jgi:hypothetical protein
MTKKVVVEQYHNPKYVESPDVGCPKESPFTYRVVFLRNVTRPGVGQYLTEDEVEGLISSDINVEIKGIK